MTRITRKFWHVRGERWIVYCAGSQLVAITREEFDAQEIAA